MERHPRSNTCPTRPGDDKLTVRMVDGIVVIAIPSELDLDATEALVRTVGAAVSTGETVMLDLEPAKRSDPERWPHPAAHADHEPAPGRVTTAIAPGFVRLDTGNDTWTVDVVRRRFCRSAGPVDPRFVEAPSWTAVRALWVTAERTTALTVAGTYVSAPSDWTAHTSAVVAA